MHAFMQEGIECTGWSWCDKNDCALTLNEANVPFSETSDLVRASCVSGADTPCPKNEVLLFFSLFEVGQRLCKLLDFLSRCRISFFRLAAVSSASSSAASAAPAAAMPITSHGSRKEGADLETTSSRMIGPPAPLSRVSLHYMQ